MLVISQKEFDKIMKQVKEEEPIEACGVLAGKKADDRRRVTKIYKSTNVLESKHRYQIDPDELMEIYQKIDKKDLEVVGIYHSHPSSPTPSQIDKEKAVYPEVSYLIISLPEYEYASYYLEDDEFQKEELLIQKD